jgi:hypothetical protein
MSLQSLVFFFLAQSFTAGYESVTIINESASAGFSWELQLKRMRSPLKLETSFVPAVHDWTREKPFTGCMGFEDRSGRKGVGRNGQDDVEFRASLSITPTPGSA